MANKYANRNVVSVLALLGISVMVALTMWSTNIFRPAQKESAQIQRQILLRNKTTSLEITKAELNARGTAMQVAVKNVSDKNITWFRISLGPETAIEADCLFGEKSRLGPGEIYEDEYPFDQKSEQLEVTVVAVLFADRISEGDEHYAELIRNKRVGQKAELARLVSLLRLAADKANSQNPAASISDLEVSVSNLQNEEASGKQKLDMKTEARLIGMKTARGKVLNDIEQIKAKNNSREVHEGLTSLNERYGKLLESLKEYEF